MSPSPGRLVAYVCALAGFITVTFAFGRYIFSQITPQLVEALHLDYEFVGRINFLNQGCYLLFSVVGGLLSARLGPRILISTAALASGMSVLALAWVTDKWALLALVSLQGVFGAVVWVPMVELVSRGIPERKRGLALGAISSGTSYGVILNGLMVPRIMAAYDWTMVWRVFGVLSLVLGAVGAYIMYTFPEPARPAPGMPVAAPRRMGVGGALSSETGLLIILLALTGLYLVPFQFYLTPLVETDLGGSQAVSGRCWTILGFVGLVSGLGGGWLADRLSAKKAMLIAYALSVVSLLVLVALKGTFFIYLSCFLFGLVYNAIFGFHPTYVSRVRPPEQTARLFGVLNLAAGFGSMIGGYLIGYLGKHGGGFLPAYWTMGGLAVAAVLICWRLKDDRQAGSAFPPAPEKRSA